MSRSARYALCAGFIPKDIEVPRLWAAKMAHRLAAHHESRNEGRFDEDLFLRSCALPASRSMVFEMIATTLSLAARMLRVFVGNNFAHYTADFRNTTIEATGKRVPQYRDVKGPPTLEEFVKHLNGELGLLAIPVTEAGACRWGKIDVDDYEGDPVARAQKYAQLIARWGLPLMAELSKSGGVQLGHYSPYTESATDMRAKLADWCAALHIPPGTEIFPKQERLMKGEKGSGINLPYFGGDDPKTRNFAVDKEGRRLTVSEWLDAIENMPAKPTYTPGQVNIEAASDLLAKHWTDGQRDNLSMAVGGALLRAGVDTEVIQEVLETAMNVTGDTGTHLTAAQLETMMSVGKKVPGYPKMVEYMGAEDAREFMRLAGGKPPPDPLPFSFAPIAADWLNVVPPAVTYTIEPLLPTGVVGMLVAEGGAGKTTFGLRMAIAVAGGRDLFDLKTKQGRVVYIACEEHEAALRRRVHWIVSRETERMREEKETPEAIELFTMNLLANLTLTSAVGYELHLISARNGETAQSTLIDALIEKLPKPLELLVMDPISRLNGGEENSNQVGTALVNAAERIAREVGCTLLLCHHTGKAAAKDREVGLYAARGASGFVDAARSSIRLLQADLSDVREFSNVPPGVVEAGDLVQVIHNKSNEGPKAPAFWLRRQALDFERFEPIIVGGIEAAAKLMLCLYDWYCRNGKAPFAITRVTNNAEVRKEIWPRSTVSRDRAREILARAQDLKDLESVDPTDKVNAHPLWRFRDDFGSESM